MYPKQSQNFERVKPDDWIEGKIVDIERDEQKETEYKGEKRVIDSIRFVFELNGYKFPKKSRWMAFSYHKKAGLFQKYLVSLVEGAKPYMKFNLMTLKGMAVKVMYSANGEWDNLEMLRPLGAKLKPESVPQEEHEPPEVVDQTEDDIQF